MAQRHDVVIVGAGIVGITLGLQLLREGLDVAVVDPAPARGGATFGSAGMISPDSFLPQSMPSMIRHLPRWLSDPMGPVTLHPAELLRRAPWFWHWFRAGSTPARVRALVEPIFALHRDCYADWQALLGEETFARVFRRQGQIHAWESPVDDQRNTLVSLLRKEHGIEHEFLDGDALRRHLPFIGPRVQGGIHLPSNGHVTAPADLADAVMAQVVEAGGRVVTAACGAVVAEAPGLWRLCCAEHNLLAPKVVIAAGFQSAKFVAPYMRLALQSERGYHVQLDTPEPPVHLPVSIRSRGFAVSPLEGGVRAAGTIEIAPAGAPPNMARARLLERHFAEIFPGCSVAARRYWSGNRPSTPDSLPLMGRVGQATGLFVSTGHGHTGLTTSPASAKLMSGLILGRPDAEAALAPYSPARFS